MGQEQSNTVGAKNPPSLTPSTSTSTNKRSLYTIAHQQQSDDNEIEDNSVIEEEEPEAEEGIIQVVRGPDDAEEDEELALLRKIQRFEPFIKEQDKGFSIEHLLGLKPKDAKSKDPNKEVQAISDPFLDIFFGLQAHIKEQMSHINLEQRILLKRIAYVDELSTASAQTMTAAFNQAKLAADKVSEAAIIKEQADRAQHHTIDIFKALSKLEQYLDPEDRVLVTNDIDSKWPVLNQLRIKAAKATDVPLLERYISSASDMTTVGTSTSPLIEKVIVTGEPALSEAPHFQNDPSKTKSTSTSSLALNRLRGLSSKSITKTSSHNEA
ncbi:hypothetical protein V8B55DRAFT_1520461 [Mucor lusitanicus]|uniref:BLOC-1-related complex subunit 5 n=1 Tax=Mucor circinelloides f. lusitanicus TaxID=29924 RepID=A0A8H4BCL8_MUCCL|nr:hypothetical protein FB192DRAFT_1394385 [Mucor lusitanicus]